MDSQKLIIIGANGQLGKELQAKYPDATAIDTDGLDITDEHLVVNYGWSNFNTIINAAAYTNVDKAETKDGRGLAWQVNAVGVKNLVSAASKNNLTLVHISTDYVFDGTINNHDETEPFTPISVYGDSKAAGDIVVSTAQKYFILRTSWVIGDGKNFVRTMLGLGANGTSPTVIADQVGRPTFTTELVLAIDHLLDSGSEFGTYNVSNSGDVISWADFTRAIFKEAGYDLAVTDTTTKEYYKDKPDIAPRPLNSQLDLNKIIKTGFSPADWKLGLKKYVEKELAK